MQLTWDARTIGKKRLAEEELDRQKKRGRHEKRENTRNENFVANPCPRCLSVDHRSSRSQECPYFTQSTKQMLNEKLGTNRETFARKSSFQVSVRPEFREGLLENVHFLSRALRAIVVKTQLFLNFYFIHHEGSIAPYCFTQNFFYSVMQLVQGKQVTSNTDKCPPDISASWNTYKNRLMETDELECQEILSTRLRISTVLTEACVMLSTAYHNHIVENFHGRICSMFKYKLQTVFRVTDN
jgi:hypothetical protein